MRITITTMEPEEKVEAPAEAEEVVEESVEEEAAPAEEAA